MAVNPAGQTWSALEKVPRFLEEVERAGFKWQEGKFTYYDLIQKACENEIFTALGNNPWPNAYFTLQMPNPEEVNYKLPYALMWQMRQDEAIVLIGQTPPSIRYFSFQSWVHNRLLLWPTPTMFSLTAPWLVLHSAIVSVNNLTVNTIGPDPYDRPVVYIITANKQTEQHVSKLVLNAGFPQAVFNTRTNHRFGLSDSWWSNKYHSLACNVSTFSRSRSKHNLRNDWLATFDNIQSHNRRICRSSPSN